MARAQRRARLGRLNDDAMRDNPLKHRLPAGLPSFVFGVQATRSPAVVAVAQAGGHDAICVDFRYGAVGIEAAATFQAALHAGVTALARISHLNPGFIGGCWTPARTAWRWPMCAAPTKRTSSSARSQSPAR